MAARLEGAWTSRTWVRHVTSFFEAGGTHVLVGTRGLLGEGWDARRITGLVDLTAVTTTTAVVQTRGRALRTDPLRPDKVALNWSVTCVADDHPRGDNDWRRLVRKHAGYFGVDEQGEVVDGVAHLDEAFSPFAPPAGGRLRRDQRPDAAARRGPGVVRERWRSARRTTTGRRARCGSGPGRAAPWRVDGRRAPVWCSARPGSSCATRGGRPRRRPVPAGVAPGLVVLAALGAALACAARCRRRPGRRGGGRSLGAAPARAERRARA